MGGASQKFDRKLFTLKQSELSHRMQIKSATSDGRAGAASRTTGGSFLVNIVDGQLALLGEWLEGIDRIGREVWQTQGEAITPEFVREILVPEAMTLIGAREGAIKYVVAAAAQRRHLEDPHGAQSRLAMAVGKLKANVNNHYEIEARELEYQSAQTKEGTTPRQASQPRHIKKAPKAYRVPPPVRPVSTAFTSFTLSSREPKPTRIPPNPPSYFPSDLWPKTCVVLAEARKRFPDRRQTPELCKHTILEMTPLFCEAVKAGTMKAGAVLQEGLGGMGDLLHSLLVYNDDGPHDGFSSLSREGYRIGQEARQSDEWLRLARAIVDTEEKRKGVASASGRRAENIDRIRKECGWSFDILADKTGIDKKLILSHVNRRTKPGPRIMKEYAQAFSKALGRQILVADLEK